MYPFIDIWPDADGWCWQHAHCTAYTRCLTTDCAILDCPPDIWVFAVLEMKITCNLQTQSFMTTAHCYYENHTYDTSNCHVPSIIGSKPCPSLPFYPLGQSQLLTHIIQIEPSGCMEHGWSTVCQRVHEIIESEWTRTGYKTNHTGLARRMEKYVPPCVHCEYVFDDITTQGIYHLLIIPFPPVGGHFLDEMEKGAQTSNRSHVCTCIYRLVIHACAKYGPHHRIHDDLSGWIVHTDQHSTIVHQQSVSRLQFRGRNQHNDIIRISETHQIFFFQFAHCVHHQAQSPHKTAPFTLPPQSFHYISTLLGWHHKGIIPSIVVCAHRKEIHFVVNVICFVFIH